MAHNWNYFKPNEVVGVDSEVVAKLDAARHKAGIPFIIAQPPVRTPERNAAVGGVADSAHLRGLAIDLHVADSTSLFRMISALLEVGFQRLVIGIRIEAGKVVYHNLHVDLDTSLPRPVLALKLYT